MGCSNSTSQTNVEGIITDASRIERPEPKVIKASYPISFISQQQHPESI